MKLRKAFEAKVTETKTSRMMAEEEVEEEDDHATLQDCLDRQKKVTSVRNKSKRIALTPLDEEDCWWRGRKKSKGIHEILAADPAFAFRSGESSMPFSNHKEKTQLTILPIDGVETSSKDLQEARKRKVKKKRRRSVDNVAEAEGNGVTALYEKELLDNASENSEDLSTSEWSRKFFIRVAKVELADGRRFGSAVTADNHSDLGTGSPDYFTDLPAVQDVLLPGDGYHTCGDAESCRKIPCLELVLVHLDKMSEEQLKLWYNAIIGEVFVSRNGEKVRGRLRRMIKCKAKQIIQSQFSESTVSSQSWRSSPARQQACGALSPTSKSVVADDVDSPGSKLSASNAGDGRLGAEDAICSLKATSKRASLAVSLSSSSEISRELTFQLTSSTNSSAREASANSSIEDPEPVLPVVTARVTRSKARDLVKNGGTEQEDERNTVNEKCQYQSNLDQSLQSESRGFEVPEFNLSLPVSACLEDCNASDLPGHGATATAEPPLASRSCKRNFALNKDLKTFLSPEHVDLFCPPEEEADETADARTPSLKRSLAVEEALGEHSPSVGCHRNDLTVENAAAVRKISASRLRNNSFGVETVVGEVPSASDCALHGQPGEGVGTETSGRATRSRKKKDFALADKVMEGVPSSAECDVKDPKSGAAETVAAASCSGKKKHAFDALREVSSRPEYSSNGVRVDGGAVQTIDITTRSRKKKEIVVTEKVLREVSSPVDCAVSRPAAEEVAAEPANIATRSRTKSFVLIAKFGEIPPASDSDPSGLSLEGDATEPIAATTRSRKKRELLVPRDCDASGLFFDVAVIQKTAAASRSRKKRGSVAAVEGFGEIPSSADSGVVDAQGEVGAAETIDASRSCKESFGTGDLGEVPTLADCSVNDVLEHVSAVGTIHATAKSLLQGESVAAEGVEISTSADCDPSNTPLERAVGEKSTAAASSRDESLAPEDVPVEASSSLDCAANGLVSEVGGVQTTVAATRLCTYQEFGAAEVPTDVSILAHRAGTSPIGGEETWEPSNSSSPSKEKVELAASEVVLGDFSLSPTLDCYSGRHHNAEEPSQCCQYSGEVREESGEGLPSLSDLVMRILSDNTSKCSVTRSDCSDFDCQQSCGSATRQNEKQPFLSGPRVEAFDEAWDSTLTSAVSPPTGRSSSVFKIVETSDQSFEGTQLSDPFQSRCQSVLSVCKHDVDVEETLTEIDKNSCADLGSKDFTSNLSCTVARSPWDEASEFADSSDLCRPKSSVVVISGDIDDLRNNAPSNLDSERVMEDFQVEQGSVTEPVLLKLSATSSSSPLVCPASSSGSVMEITGYCKLNTECEELDEDDDVGLPHEEITESSDPIIRSDCSSILPSSASISLGDQSQLADGGRRRGLVHRDSGDIKHGSAEGGYVLFETGDANFFDLLSAEKVSTLWPVAEEQVKYLSTRISHETEDGAESNPVCEMDRSTSCGPDKWQVKGAARSSKELAAEAINTFGLISVPKLWRDAGEFLEELDNVYTMLGGNSSLYPLGKRKHHFSDVDDFRSECLGDDTQCDSHPPRKKQRLELVTVREDSAVCGMVVAKTNDVSKATDDLEDLGDDQHKKVNNGSPTSVDSHTCENAGISAICEEVQEFVRSKYQEMWMDDQRRVDGEILTDESQSLDIEMPMCGTSSGASLFTGNDCLSPPPPCLEDPFLAEMPPCHSPASQSTFEEEGSPKSGVNPEACLNPLAGEGPVEQEDDPEDYEQPSDNLTTNEIAVTRDEDSDDIPSPARRLHPIRIKLPSGRTRHIASALTESKLKSSTYWRFSDDKVLIGKPSASSAHSLSPNSSDEDVGGSIQEQESSKFESAPAPEVSGQKLRLVLSPTSPQSSLPPLPSTCDSSSQQENVRSPECHVPPPHTARSAKGILKTSPKCKECVELRSRARTASDFVASQMKTFGEVAGRLTKEVQDLRSILESQVSTSRGGCQEDDTMQDTVKAISRSKDVERSSEKNLALLLRDCKRFCKLTAKQPQRRIVFADEAGKKLCHVKTFQSPPALARSLLDYL